MTRPWKRGLGMAVAALALVTFSAHADERQKTQEKIGKQAVKKLEYVNDVAMGDQGQIAMANLALQKSQNPQVRQFAQQLIQDHQQSLGNLRDWAKTRGIEVTQVYLTADEAAVGGSGLSEKTQQSLGKEAQEANERIDKKTNEMRGELDKLRSKSGADFDKAFISQAIDGQKQGLRLAQEGISDYKGDVSFSMVLNQRQPTLQRNLETAKSLEKSLKG